MIHCENWILLLESFRKYFSLFWTNAYMLLLNVQNLKVRTRLFCKSITRTLYANIVILVKIFVAGLSSLGSWLFQNCWQPFKSWKTIIAIAKFRCLLCSSFMRKDLFWRSLLDNCWKTNDGRIETGASFSVVLSTQKTENINSPLRLPFLVYMKV